VFGVGKGGEVVSTGVGRGIKFYASNARGTD
jgi:hypothetical protein